MCAQKAFVDMAFQTVGQMENQNPTILGQLI